jgi:hypothetical protein
MSSHGWRATVLTLVMLVFAVAWPVRASTIVVDVPVTSGQIAFGPLYSRLEVQGNDFHATAILTPGVQISVLPGEVVDFSRLKFLDGSETITYQGTTYVGNSTVIGSGDGRLATTFEPFSLPAIVNNGDQLVVPLTGSLSGYLAVNSQCTAPCLPPFTEDWLQFNLSGLLNGSVMFVASRPYWHSQALYSVDVLSDVPEPATLLFVTFGLVLSASRLRHRQHH